MWGVLSCLFHSGSCQVNMYFLSASDKPRKKVGSLWGLSEFIRMKSLSLVNFRGPPALKAWDSVIHCGERMLSPTPRPSPVPSPDTHQLGPKSQGKMPLCFTDLKLLHTSETSTGLSPAQLHSSLGHSEVTGKEAHWMYMVWLKERPPHNYRLPPSHSSLILSTGRQILCVQAPCFQKLPVKCECTQKSSMYSNSFSQRHQHFPPPAAPPQVSKYRTKASKKHKKFPPPRGR